MSEATLAGKRRRILEFIAEQIREGLSAFCAARSGGRWPDVPFDGPYPPPGPAAGGIPAARLDQAEGDHRELGAVLRRRHPRAPRGARTS